MYRIVSQARWFYLLALALVALAIPAWSFAQAPTFNAFTSTHKGGGDYWNRVGVAAVGDFDGDGKQDAFVTDGSPNLRLMLGNGNGTFAVQYVYTTATSGPVLVRAADLNGDGRLDAVAASGQGDLKPLVLLNTGNVSGVPQFTVTPYAAFGSGVRSVTVGDLNGDGRPEFIVGNAYASLRVYLNDGNGAFTLEQTTSITGPGGPSVGTGVIADLNGDGNADYVVASSQSPTTNVFFGNGDGTLQAPVEITSNSFQVTVADVNDDGNPDLLEVNGAELRVYLNAGGGTFSLPTLYSTGGNYPDSVATADFNGDGNLDAVVANGNSNNVAVLLGDGSGLFSTATVYAVNQVPVDVSVGDFNGDGKLDIATLGYNQNTYAVLLNTTVFAPPLPTQTLTILGGSGNPGDIAANVEYYNPATDQWQPAYLADYAPYGHPITHPWGNVPGTTRWINYQTSGASDPGASGINRLQYLYRVRFTVPDDAVNPKMTFSLKADNFAQVAINGVAAGGLITGAADQVNVDAVFSQNVLVGQNTINLNIGDEGGLNGFNFRIVLSMQSSEPLEIVPTRAPTTTTVSFGAGPFVYTGSPFTATASTNPNGTPNIVYSGDCTNAGNTCTATATYDGDATHLGSSDTTSITIDPAPTTTTVTFGAGPFVYTGSAFTATASTSPVGTPTVGYTGDCTNAGTTCTATATYDGDQNYTGSSTSASITIARAMATVAATPYDVEYDGQPHMATFLITGVSGETGATVGTVTQNTTHTTVGTYSDVWSFAGANYVSIGATAMTNKIKDTTAPVITSLSTNAPTLWPPNHKMVAVTVSALASDLVGVTSLKIINVTSSEPDNGLGDGDTAGDIQVTGDLTLNLRAERAGKGNGRTYTITVEASDAVGNKSTKTCTVFVPKSQGK